jgi:hypothetical protein
MNRRLVLGILLTILVIVGAVGIGVSAYQAGVARGVAESARLVDPETGEPRGDGPFYPYYYGRPFGFRPFGFGFGFLGLLFPIFFFFLLFWLLRGLFWRGPWGWRGHRAGWPEDVPPMFEEWHRRAHGQSTEQTQESKSA